jgi:membrane protein YqaA with SNARE-associated domain
MLSYGGVFLVVLGVNLLPAFGPPTWSILVLYRLQSDMNAVALVIVGAVAAALGRLALGYATRLLRHKLSDERREKLDAFARMIEQRRAASVLGLGLFALSPVPSAQLFEAAGLAGMRLPPLVAAFFAGRVVSYSLYVAGASVVKETSVGDMIRDSLTSPWGIVLQLAMLAVVVLIGRIDWRRFAPPPRRAATRRPVPAGR